MGKTIDITTRLSMVKVDATREKKCKCKNRTYLVDSVNRTVECEQCGTLIDPIDVLEDIISRYDQWSKETQKIKEERRAVEKFRTRNPILNHLFRELVFADSQNLVPTCPHCKQPFEVQELTSFINRKFIRKE